MIFLHADVQTLAQRELDLACGRGGRLPCWSDCPNTPYAEALLLEVQRLGAVAAFGLQREASKDVEVGGYVIPKGTQVFALTWIPSRYTFGQYHTWARGGGWWRDTPMHVVKPYVVCSNVRTRFLGFTTHHQGPKMTVARPCVVNTCFFDKLIILTLGRCLSIQFLFEFNWRVKNSKILNMPDENEFC